MNQAVPKGCTPKRIRPKGHRQPNYLKWVAELTWKLTNGRLGVVHHLIHHKRKDRVRRDDRLVMPLSPDRHTTLHDKAGDELKYLQSQGIGDPYGLGDGLWLIWCEYGKSGTSMALCYLAEPWS